MKSFQQYVIDTCTQVNQVDIYKLAQQLQTPHLLIDIREPEEWQGGIIAGTYCCPRGILESKIEKLLVAHERNSDNDVPVYLYCRSGARSVLAAQSLKAMGVKNCFSLQGGFQAWQQAGLPCTKITPERMC